MSELLQVVEEGQLEIRPILHIEGLVVSDAGVDHHLPVRRLDDQHLNVENQVTLRRNEVGLQPRNLIQVLRGRVGQHLELPAGGGHLDELSDLGITDLPLKHGHGSFAEVEGA